MASKRIDEHTEGTEGSSVTDGEKRLEPAGRRMLPFALPVAIGVVALMAVAIARLIVNDDPISETSGPEPMPAARAPLSAPPASLPADRPGLARLGGATFLYESPNGRVWGPGVVIGYADPFDALVLTSTEANASILYYGIPPGGDRRAVPTGVIREDRRLGLAIHSWRDVSRLGWRPEPVPLRDSSLALPGGVVAAGFRRPETRDDRSNEVAPVLVDASIDGETRLLDGTIQVAAPRGIELGPMIDEDGSLAGFVVPSPRGDAYQRFVPVGEIERFLAPRVTENLLRYTMDERGHCSVQLLLVVEHLFRAPEVKVRFLQPDVSPVEVALKEETEWSKSRATAKVDLDRCQVGRFPLEFELEDPKGTTVWRPTDLWIEPTETPRSIFLRFPLLETKRIDGNESSWPPFQQDLALAEAGSRSASSTNEPAKWRTGCDRGIGYACARAGDAALPESGREARAFYERGCKAGNALACLRLGAFHDAWSPEPTSPALARSSYEKACQLGLAVGCSSAARTKKASAGAGEIELLDRSCRLGSPFGCWNLAFMHLEMGGDEGRGLAALETLCEWGFGEGCEMLGTLLAFGDEARRDLQGASRFFTRACGSTCVKAFAFRDLLEERSSFREPPPAERRMPGWIWDASSERPWIEQIFDPEASNWLSDAMGRWIEPCAAHERFLNGSPGLRGPKRTLSMSVKVDKGRIAGQSVRESTGIPSSCIVAPGGMEVRAAFGASGDARVVREVE
ncbi:tetratricopeptide repeat protein [Vulgatibacter incomptus]|uniref:Beta-lactamase n=1 Tax=Vulgatibacter incomptus TaxID=1391653 RepID=A0A0K1PBZ3_9BACT|nr:sel1 repeat family protein [Vulgatibacter incomptus]AKU91045.1 hypothetical protein AKJ08_1432 [Vulgatibacter incomptus]